MSFGKSLFLNSSLYPTPDVFAVVNLFNQGLSVLLQLECGQMPNVMAALSNIGDKVQRRKVLADAPY